MVKLTECEVKNESEWTLISIEKALELRAATAHREFRCPECHGKVRLHEEGGDGMHPAHAEHLPLRYGTDGSWLGCSRSSYFDGKRRLHPEALE